MPEAPELEITVQNRQRGQRVPREALAEFVRRLAREKPPPGPATLAVELVSEKRMRELNRRFRGRDVATDVLSFPGGEDDPPGEARHLGDIAIAVGTAARQAHSAGHSLRRELERLVLHGYLHLLGYDHETDDGAMLRVERRLDRRLADAARRRGSR